MSCFCQCLTAAKLTLKTLTPPAASARRLCEFLSLECLPLLSKIQRGTQDDVAGTGGQNCDAALYQHERALWEFHI